MLVVLVETKRVIKNMRIMINIAYFLYFLLIVHADSEVETTHGKVVGRQFKTLYEEKKYYGFMGIPFAAPPIKDLRFKPPQQIGPWDKVLQATKVKPACVQYNMNIRKGQRLGQYGVEDCLYLDIYTPGMDEYRRPVIVFLYNEFFKNSYNKTKDYAPDFFIEEDVLVVMISHRLSVFGFLSFDDETLSGNAGLKDIVAGLEWVSNNIKSFGGDREKITLLGSQGGAAAVDLLIRSKAKILFNSAILQSGTSLNPSYLQQNARERALKLAELLEIASSSTNQILRELNNFPASKLLTMELRASPPDYFKENQRGILTFGPIVEKDLDGLVTEYPEDSSENINIPVMIGFNSREGLAASFTYLMEPHYLKFVEKDFPFLTPVRLKYTFDPLYDSYFNAINEIKKFYFTGGTVTVNSASEYITYMGDLKAYAMDKMAKMYSNISASPVYYYYFDYYSELNENKDDLLRLSVVEDGTWGAATGDELCYLFKCPSLKDKYLKYKEIQSEEVKMQRKLIKMWANFAKYGNPTPDENNPLENTKWPPYTKRTKEYLHINKIIEVKRDLLKERFKFWDKFIRRWEIRAKEGVVAQNIVNNDEL